MKTSSPLRPEGFTSISLTHPIRSQRAEQKEQGLERMLGMLSCLEVKPQRAATDHIHRYCANHHVDFRQWHGILRDRNESKEKKKILQQETDAPWGYF
jgi:hypothetical protein